MCGGREEASLARILRVVWSRLASLSLVGSIAFACATGEGLDSSSSGDRPDAATGPGAGGATSGSGASTGNGGTSGAGNAGAVRARQVHLREVRFAQLAPAQIDAKVANVRSAAGDRLDQLELNALVQYVEITNDRAASAAAVARRLDVDPAIVLGTPYMLTGTVAEIVEQLHRARERWGFSYYVTRDPAQTAPIIAALR